MYRVWLLLLEMNFGRISAMHHVAKNWSENYFESNCAKTNELFKYIWKKGRKENSSKDIDMEDEMERHEKESCSGIINNGT